MIEALEFLAVVSAALFAGASLYINVAEHPARMLMDTRNAAMQWAPSYKRATWLQAPLAVVSFCAGTAVWFAGGGNSDEARELLVRWGKLHGVRTLLSLCAAAIYAWIIVRA